MSEILPLNTFYLMASILKDSEGRPASEIEVPLDEEHVTFNLILSEEENRQRRILYEISLRPECFAQKFAGAASAPSERDPLFDERKRITENLETARQKREVWRWAD